MLLAEALVSHAGDNYWSTGSYVGICFLLKHLLEMLAIITGQQRHTLGYASCWSTC